MCRLMAYMGDSTLLAHVVLWPDRSIIKQSYSAAERISDPSLPAHLGLGNLNADGFGIGWYPDRSAVDEPPKSALTDAGTASACSLSSTPGLFKSVTPAWNCENLARLACKIHSSVVFAHVRAAYPGMPVSDQNCHPFISGRYMWMHNGVVAGFSTIRRTLVSLLSDAVYATIASFHSDSALCFALFLEHLPESKAPHPPAVILRAVEQTIATIHKVQLEAGIQEDVSLLNFVVTDGSCMVATRFVSPASRQAASLYYAEGSAFERQPSTVSRDSAGQPGGASSSKACEAPYEVAFSERSTRVVLVASEPVTSSRTDWVCLPKNTALIVTENKHGSYNVTRSPLHVSGSHPKQAEVRRCLEALKVSDQVKAAPYERSTPDRAHPRGVPQSPGGRGLATPFLLPKVSLSSPGGATPALWTCFCGREHPGERGNPGRPTAPSRAASLLAPGLQPSEPGVPSPGLLSSELTRLSNGMSRRGSLSQEGQTAPTWTGSLDEHVLTGHTSTVLCMTLHQDMLVTSSSDTTIRVWRLADYAQLAVLAGHRRPVVKMVVHGDMLYSTAGRVLRVWSLKTFENVHVCKSADDDGCVRALVVTDQGQDAAVLVGSQDGSLKKYLFSEEAWSPCLDALGAAAPLSSSQLLSTAPTTVSDPEHHHLGSVNSMQLVGPYLATTGADAAIKLWEPTTLQHRHTLHGHRGAVMALLAAGGLLFSGGRDNVLRVWDVHSLMCRRTLQGHTNDILHIAAVSPDDLPGGYDSPCQDGTASERPQPNLIASCSLDCSVRVWSTSTFSCLRIVQITDPHCMPSLCCALNANILATGSQDGLVRVWNLEDTYGQLLCDPASDHDAASPWASPVTTLLSTCVEVEDRPPRGPTASGPLHGGVPRPRLSLSSGAALNRRSEQALVAALKDFCAIQTVSPSPSLRDACFDGAKFVAHQLESVGCEVLMCRPQDDQNPVVFGRLIVDPALPTVTFYGHYDVQPANERGWKTDPFVLHSQDGYLYARGVSDNKGPILAFIWAVKEMLADCGTLPTNVCFVIEGEEECGSFGFKEVLTRNKHFCDGTDLVVISNTNWVGETTPCLTYGMRGMISLAVEVTGPTRDLHSGNEGGIFEEPLSDMLKVVASLLDSSNSITVPGFYEGVDDSALDVALPGLANSAEFNVKDFQQRLGLPALTARSPVELLRQRWCMPSLSVVDMRVGDHLQEDEVDSYRFGPTRYSVIPRSAVCMISIRFVPGQTSEELIRLLTDHMSYEFAKLRSPNALQVKVRSVGDFWEADCESELFKLAEAALLKEWAVQPLYVREGGTMPVASTLEKVIGAPAVMIPMGQSTDNCHLENERLRRVNLVKGKNVIKRLLREVGDNIRPGRAAHHSSAAAAGQ